MLKHRLTNAALFAGSLLIGALVIEAGLRTFGDQRHRPYTSRLGEEKVREPFPGVEYVYPGNAGYAQAWPSNPRGYFDPGKNSIAYRVNNYGFRDADFTLARNEKIRIAFLGDSFCWGLGVREEDLFATRIEQRLDQQRPLGHRYEVYNFCLPGYSTAEEAALYSYVVRHFQPDLLVIWYHLNDVNADGQNYIDRDARRHIKRRSEPEGRWPQWRLLGLVREASRRRTAHRSFVESFERAYQVGHPGLRSVEGALQRIRGLGQEPDVARFLTISPWLYRLDGGRYPFTSIHAAVASRAAAEGFEVLDLLPVFEGSRARDLWVHPQDPHPNEIGHAMAAQAMSDLLVVRLEEMGEDLLSAAQTRRLRGPASPLEGSPRRQWHRAFVELGEVND